MTNSLAQLIKQKQDAIAKLQAELDEALGLLSRGRPAAPLPTPGRQPIAQTTRRGSKVVSQTPPRKVGAPGIVPTSSVGLAVAVLRQAGKPLHIKEIIRGIEERGQKVMKTTLVGNLSRYVNAKQVFYRAALGTYGLLEWKKAV